MLAKNYRCTILKYIERRQYNEILALGHGLMSDRLTAAQNLFRKDLYSHYGCVNAIEFSNDGEWLVSGGDDRRVLVWNVEKALQGKGEPTNMKGEHGSNIFCLGFDNTRQKIFSAGNDEQVIVHDFKTCTTLDVFLHEEAVYGISVDPLNDNVFASACEDGRILIWDIREPASTDPFCLAKFSSAFHAVMYNPVEPRLVATANSKEGVSLWDVRAPRKSCLTKYGTGTAAESCMSVRFCRSGNQILALRRRLPPVLFDLHSSVPSCQFDHREYYNSCTMKSCCFAGDRDQYILSGSDDFNLYMWKIPEEGSKVNWVDEAHLVLRGHRSIVNQVRFNASNFLLASSGVEKIIKLWSPFPVPNSKGGLNLSTKSGDKDRKVYSHEEYISLILQSGQVMSHDYSHKSTSEDPRMMAFFDSLVQREIEGWNSDNSFSSANTENATVVAREQPSSSDTSSGTSSEGEMGLSGRGLSPLTVAYVSAIANRVGVEHLGNSATINSVLLSNAPSQNSTVEGTESSNRISQLIAQKRQQLLKAARAKNSQQSKSRKRSHSHRSSKRNESQSRVRINLGISDSSSNDEDEDILNRHAKIKIVASRSSSHDSKAHTERRRLLRNRRAKILKDLPDSDSDTLSIPVSIPREATASTENKNISVCPTEENSIHVPSTSVQHNGPDADSRTSINDSGASDIDSHVIPLSLNGSSETHCAGAGTPDSGIATSVSESTEAANVVSNDTGASAWTQFKRIRSRLEKACRNYRSRSSDARDQSE